MPYSLIMLLAMSVALDEIVMGAGGYISENDLFRRPATQEGGDLVEELATFS